MNNDSTTYDALVGRRAALLTQLKSLDEQIEQFRLATLGKVSVSKTGKTITLKTFGGRVLKAVKNRHGRYQVKENKAVVVRECMGNLHDIRFALALGTI